MKRLFQKPAVFYSTVFVVALLLQWLVSRSQDEEIRQADNRVDALKQEFEGSFNQPNGVLISEISSNLNLLQNTILENYGKLRDHTSFFILEDYGFDQAGVQSSLNARVILEERLNQFNRKNKQRLEHFDSGKFAPSFNTANTGLDTTPERLNDYVLQMSIVEELLNRLEASGTLPNIEALSASLPRLDSAGVSMNLGKMVKKLSRCPIVLELNADFGTLDRLFAGLRMGKGCFFLEEIEFQDSVDWRQWSGSVHCKITLSAFSIEMQPAVPVF